MSADELGQADQRDAGRQPEARFREAERRPLGRHDEVGHHAELEASADEQQTFSIFEGGFFGTLLLDSGVLCSNVGLQA